MVDTSQTILYCYYLEIFTPSRFQCNLNALISYRTTKCINSHISYCHINRTFISYILIDYRIVKLSAFLYCQKCGRTRTLPTTYTT